MTTTNATVLCGTCKCAVKTVPNPKAHDQVSCPRCGRSDRFDKVMATVREFVVHFTQKRLAEELAKTNRRNSFIKLTVKQPSNRSFRWVCSDARV